MKYFILLIVLASCANQEAKPDMQSQYQVVTEACQTVCETTYEKNTTGHVEGYADDPKVDMSTSVVVCFCKDTHNYGEFEGEHAPHGK